MTAAANLLGVGRPALSNLLNGNAALSPAMAAKLEKAFGIETLEILDRQMAFDIEKTKALQSLEDTIAYVPPFLQLKADDIHRWASFQSARSRLAVFLRTLVNSTGVNLQRPDFPGNEDSEHPGWDGFVEAGKATQWIPAGKSGWEFGCNRDPRKKANKDYAKSLGQNSFEERKSIVFIFVTPRRWIKKKEWEKEHRANGHWKDVIAYDASDLEQWLEQSIPAQAWLVNELGNDSEGVLSLDQCWKTWIADCDPPMKESLFGAPVKTATSLVKRYFSQRPTTPFVVSADSSVEALAFLHCLFSQENDNLGSFRDRIVVFSKTGALTKLASESTNFIPVIISREVEREFASWRTKIHAVLVNPRNVTSEKPDIELNPLGNAQFQKSLEEMGCPRNDIKRLDYESGGSLTVLRRRLSKLEAIRTPEWASDLLPDSALIPFFFAGAWNEKNPADQTVLSLLAEDREYGLLEKDISKLRLLEDPPMWSVGTYRGVVSKIDLLFAISKHIVRDDLDRFLDVAEKLVLSEDDPALDLPKDRRWAAVIYEKTRDVSATLRDGVGETLVLLAVYGIRLFRKHLGIDLEFEVSQRIRRLLSPLTTRKLEAHTRDLPMYAEAAPAEFLKIIEEDLRTEKPQTLELMRPVGLAMFERCYRTGLLWALENIAWSPEHFLKCVIILAQLAQFNIDDKFTNKPLSTLRSIFRYWMPQTAAIVEERIAALDFLAEKYPEIAWDIACQQFNGQHPYGDYNQKPRWRRDAYGYGDPITRGESVKFVRHTLDLALKWKNHTRETLADLVECMNQLEEEDQRIIWSLILEWSKSALDDDKAWLREKIRTWRFSRIAAINSKKLKISKDTLNQAQQIYECLQPTDIVFQYEWLFRNDWIDNATNGYDDENYDLKKSEEKTKNRRIEALHVILGNDGLNGILKLADQSNAASTIGYLLREDLLSGKDALDAIKHIVAKRGLSTCHTAQNLIGGIMNAMNDAEFEGALTELTTETPDDLAVKLFTIAPFFGRTWKILDETKPALVSRYWTKVSPRRTRHKDTEITTAVKELLSVHRPREAFCFSHFEIEKIPAQLLFSMLKEIATTSEEGSSTYQLEHYYITKAFEALNASGEITVEDMAHLEFLYIDFLYLNEDRIPNLEKQVERNPDFFVQVLASVNKREDDLDDPTELKADSIESLQRYTDAVFKFIGNIRRIPGHDEKTGELRTAGIVDWVRQARAKSRELSLLEMCDFYIGEILSHALAGEDGVWPCEPVRDAVEELYTPSLDEDIPPLHKGVMIGLLNSRGVSKRGMSGNQEREEAAKYQRWGSAMECTHPNVAAIMRDMANHYLDYAQWVDTDRLVRKRLR